MSDSVSPLAGVGSALQGATAMMSYLIGTKTSSSSTGYSSAANSAWAQDTTNTTQKTASTTNSTSTTDNVITTGSNSDTKTTNSADPAVIMSLKNLAAQAMANSNDPNKTQGLLSGILQNATDAMKAVFGQSKQAGIYNDSASVVENNDLLSRAAADAASAILGYRSSQQGIASDALNNLLKATATSDVATSANSRTDNLSTTNASSTTLGETDTTVTDNAYTHTESVANQHTQSKSKSGMSVVCSWMFRNKKLSARRYYFVTKDFNRMMWYSRKGYMLSCQPLVRMLEKDGNHLASRIVIGIFAKRTEYVCALYGVPDCKRSILGWISRALVAIYSTPMSLYFWTQHVLGYEQELAPNV